MVKICALSLTQFATYLSFLQGLAESSHMDVKIGVSNPSGMTILIDLWMATYSS